MYAETTIVAPATPYGYGGISVIRLSGLDCINIIQNNISRGSGDLAKNPRVAVNSNFKTNGGTNIDRVVLTYFKAPRSYTGEDVLEISCHGNPAIVQKIISICCENGAAMAEPGEFTKRAYLNGKMDLIQAEAVAELIRSKSEEGAALNYKIVSGDLSNQFSTVQDKLLSLLSSIEFNLDISEDEFEPGYITNVKERVSEILSAVDRLLSGHRQAQLITTGATVVIAGRPNVGKSTLLNSLSNTSRAIISDQPGTTRDSIETMLMLEGVPVRLVDTAGLRTTDDTIEKEGVSRTKKHIDNADLTVFVSSPDVDGSPDYASSGKFITVFNKSDLLITTKPSNGFDCVVSAKYRDGIQSLLRLIKKELSISPSLSDSASLTSARQFDALSDARSSILRCENLLSDNSPALELVAADTRAAIGSLDAILGKTTTDDVLNKIFNSFCVGK